MEDEKKPEVSSQITSAAAFVEGGIQDSCDDACSICLEEFSESDPSTVTNCKHDFHLQCILEWCQRSSECPMCLQPVSFKDPSSQELLEAVEQERKLRAAPSRDVTTFHHPMLGVFQMQRLPGGVSDAELEERIMQHFAAAAAAMERNHHYRRGGQRNRLSAGGHPQFSGFSTYPSVQPESSGHISSSLPVEESELPTVTEACPSSPVTLNRGQPSPPTVRVASLITDQGTPASGSSMVPTDTRAVLLNAHGTAGHSSSADEDGEGPSDAKSFSEFLRSRFNSVSMRYRESFSRSTRGLKERLFSRNNSMSDIGPGNVRETNDGIASVSRIMDFLQNGDNNRANGISLSNHSNNRPTGGQSE